MRRFQLIPLCQQDFYLWIWNKEPADQINQLNLLLQEFKASQAEARHILHYQIIIVSCSALELLLLYAPIYLTSKRNKIQDPKERNAEEMLAIQSDYNLKDVSKSELTGFLGNRADMEIHKVLQINSKERRFKRAYADGTQKQCFYISVLQAVNERFEVSSEEIHNLKILAAQKIDELLPDFPAEMKEETRKNLDPSESVPVDASGIFLVSEILAVNVIVLQPLTIYPSVNLLPDDQSNEEKEKQKEIQFQLALHAYGRVDLAQPTIFLYHRMYMDRTHNDQSGHYELLAFTSLNDDNSIQFSFKALDSDVQILRFLNKFQSSQQHIISKVSFAPSKQIQRLLTFKTKWTQSRETASIYTKTESFLQSMQTIVSNAQ
jgi:hypothetical protein